MPFVLGESQYEGFKGNDIGTPYHVRRQAWWTMLSGGAGHAYGARTWNFPENWRIIMEYPGSWQLKHVIDFFDKISWWTLVPDQRHKFIVAGYGDWIKPNYVTAALSHNKKLGVAYVPKRTTLVVDLKQMVGMKVEIQWYDPRTGKYTDSQIRPSNQLELLTPPENEDWVLLIETTD
jgi:hypothetical protein